MKKIRNERTVEIGGSDQYKSEFRVKGPVTMSLSISVRDGPPVNVYTMTGLQKVSFKNDDFRPRNQLSREKIENFSSKTDLTPDISNTVNKDNESYYLIVENTDDSILFSSPTTVDIDAVVEAENDYIWQDGKKRSPIVDIISSDFEEFKQESDIGWITDDTGIYAIMNSTRTQQEFYRIKDPEAFFDDRSGDEQAAKRELRKSDIEPFKIIDVPYLTWKFDD